MINLLKFENGQICLETIYDDLHAPDFAILSHTWLSDESEVKYHDIIQNIGQSKEGFRKIKNCGEQATKDGCLYFWVDTCCINKTIGSEVSEAINSMYRWYSDAKICYAYMQDVHGKDWKAFENSRWFSRGWTLQELLASKAVRFYNSEWELLGDKISLGSRIAKATGIHMEVLQDPARIRDYSIAERMSWTARRETTKVEDRAYSLLGIYGIDDMTMMYGQKEAAFRVLQEKILALSDDYSIFAWEDVQKYGPGLLATSPDAFAQLGDLRPTLDPSSYKLSKNMVDIAMRLHACGPYTYVGLLNCMSQSKDAYFAIYLRHVPTTKTYVRVVFSGEDHKWIPAAQVKGFQPVDQITIYRDPNDLRNKVQGYTYTDVPSIGLRFPEKLLDVFYTAQAENNSIQWDSNRRIFLLPPNATTTQGWIGTLHLAKNIFGIEALRVGFDRNYNPVCMLAKPYGLKHSSGARQTARVMAEFAQLPLINVLAAGASAATRSELLPAVHKGKGLLGYSADEADVSDKFWDHDATVEQNSPSKLVFDHNSRLGLWTLRGDRCLATAVHCTLLPNLEPLTAMPKYGGNGMGPAIEVTIGTDPSTDPYTWDLNLQLRPFSRKDLYSLRNKVRGISNTQGTELGTGFAMGKYN